jgi:8-oxo-dGTP pyrophosphatase MutT (NUDIX family)
MIGSARSFENEWLALREDTVRRADGSTGVFTVVEAPDIALVIPIDVDRVHLVEQYRHPVHARSWEFPSGSIDHELDTDPSVAARRELREETGLVAARLDLLGTLAITPSTMTQRCSVYVASDLTDGSPEREPAEDDMQSRWFRRLEVEQMIRSGQITDSKTIAAYALLSIGAAPTASPG